VIFFEPRGLVYILLERDPQRSFRLTGRNGCHRHVELRRRQEPKIPYRIWDDQIPVQYVGRNHSHQSGLAGSLTGAASQFIRVMEIPSQYKIAPIFTAQIQILSVSVNPGWVGAIGAIVLKKGKTSLYLPRIRYNV
jgi:hypothetical protein